MAEDLVFESLKDMNKADYVKAFKNKAIWKKAKAVIVMVDFRLDGKKFTVALPFKKVAEMKKKLKEIKATKGHFMKKTGGGTIAFENAGEDGLTAKIELMIGGLAPELLQEKGEELFGRIKATLQVVMAAEGAQDQEGQEEEEDSETVSPVAASDSSEDSSGGDDVKKKLLAVRAKIVQLNKAMNLKEGLQEQDLLNAEALQKAIRNFAALLKAADEATRHEHAEFFLKSKKLYQKLEADIKALKDKLKALDNELEDALSDFDTEEEEEDDDDDEDEDDDDDEEEDDDDDDDDDDDEEAENTVSQNGNPDAILKQQNALFDEINQLLKEVKLFEIEA